MSFKKNTLFNLMGTALPMLVGLATIPYLIINLGEVKFGVLALVWAILSYAGILDLGLSKAVTNRISILIGSGKAAIVPNFFHLARLLLTIFSIIVSVMIVATADLIAVFLKDGFETHFEARLGIYIIALAIPFVTLTSIYRGAMEAKQLFYLINIIRVPLGISIFAAPAAITYYFGANLLLIICSLVATRFIFYLIYKRIVWRLVLDSRKPESYDWVELKKALNMGVWITLTNIISPLMGYIDRFMLMTVSGAQSVAHYVAPQEIVTKLWIIPGAITTTVFPIFSKNGSEHPGNSKLFFRCLLGILALITFPVVILFAFAHEAISLWVSVEFAIASAPILKILLVGIFINCFSHVPFVYLQAVGKAKTTAMIQIIQFPFFIAALFFLISDLGVIGAAYAFLVRMCIDFLLMFFTSFKHLLWARRNFSES